MKISFLGPNLLSQQHHGTVARLQVSLTVPTADGKGDPGAPKQIETCRVHTGGFRLNSRVFIAATFLWQTWALWLNETQWLHEMPFRHRHSSIVVSSVPRSVLTKITMCKCLSYWKGWSPLPMSVYRRVWLLWVFTSVSSDEKILCCSGRSSVVLRKINPQKNPSKKYAQYLSQIIFLKSSPKIKHA